MSILVDENTRVIIQGITGRMGRFSAKDMLEYGTNVVAGVAPGRGGSNVGGIPVYNSLREAQETHAADASLLYVPGGSGLDAVREAVEGGIGLIVYPGDQVPVHDALIMHALLAASGSILVGPNTPGLLSPGKSKLGFMPSHCYTPGRLGVISKSGSLSYEVCQRLTTAGIGQSTFVGVGGDAVKGIRMYEALKMFEKDPETDAVLILGEIGGSEEYGIVDYVREGGSTPVVAFLVGKSAPPGKKLGHAGALIGSSREGYAAKVAALEAVDVPVARKIGEIVELVRLGLAREDG